MTNQKILEILGGLRTQIQSLEEGYFEAQSLIERLEKAASQDDLTGLLRRQAFMAKFQVALESSENHISDGGLILLDIDHFKNVNDTFGHDVGDQVLRDVGALLKRIPYPGAIAARLGGEEFAIFIPGPRDSVLAIAENIRKNFESQERSVATGGSKPLAVRTWRCTLSIGVSFITQQGYSAERLLKTADLALYEAKSAGRNIIKAA